MLFVAVLQMDFFPNLAYYKNPAQQSMVIFLAIVGYIFSIRIRSGLLADQSSTSTLQYSVYHSVVAHTD